MVSLEERFRREFLENSADIRYAHVYRPSDSIGSLRSINVTPQKRITGNRRKILPEGSSLKGGEDINEKSRLSTGPQSSCLLFGHRDSKVPGNLVQPPRIQKLVDRIVRIIGIVREILMGN